MQPPARPNATVRLSPAPSNEVTRLQQALIERLDPSIDAKYHIVFRYGNFLLKIPKRLGSNEVLDASVVALLARHTETSLRQDQSDHRAPAVLHYYRSLAALRGALENACEPVDTSVLCASMLLAYCQVIIPRDNVNTLYLHVSDRLALTINSPFSAHPTAPVSLKCYECEIFPVDRTPSRRICSARCTACCSSSPLPIPVFV